MAGFPVAKFQLRGNSYEYDFRKMVQKNLTTRKERAIRPPMRKGRGGKQQQWTAPSTPIVAPGKTTVVNVAPGSPGTTIQVPYPGKRGAFIAVNVPASARPGQAMLVPVPDAPTYATTAAAASAGRGSAASTAPSGGWST